jgi:colanic acid/amylovoran biosynthesis glycosyltransferase
MSAPIAYLINQYPAGSHTFIRREIHALERQGLVVHRIALRGWDAALVDEMDRRERDATRYVLAQGMGALLWATLVTLLRSPVRLFSAWRLAMRMARQSERPWPVHLAYLAEACVIRRWLAAAGVVHLHAHFATNPAEIAMLTHELGGPPYSFTAHGSDIMDRPAQMGLPMTVGRAAFAVAVCSFGRSQIMKWVPHALWQRLRVVRCGLERDYAAAAASPRPTPRSLLCVGRLSKEKGQPLLIDAARALASQGGAPDIVLAGDGPMRADIEALVREHGLASRVRVTGWLDATGVAKELQQARALVVPSLSEGLPVVIMEAMAHRLPVIAPYLAGIPELVVDGVTGWLFPAGDTDQLAQAMRHCLDASDDTLASMGDAAALRVRQMHDIDTEAAKLKALFQSRGLQPTDNPAQP